MNREERQVVINKLANIGYYTQNTEDKNTIFIVIAAMYNTSDENCIVIANHVDEVLNKNATWNPDILNCIK